MRVGTRHRGIFEYIEQRVVFPFHKRSVHGNVAGGNAERSFHFIGRNLEDFSEFFRTGFAFVSLLEFGEGFIDLLSEPTLLRGRRTIRLCSASACRILLDESTIQHRK
jgi:hypothetical protein